MPWHQSRRRGDDACGHTTGTEGGIIDGVVAGLMDAKGQVAGLGEGHVGVEHHVVLNGGICGPTGPCMWVCGCVVQVTGLGGQPAMQCQLTRANDGGHVKLHGIVGGDEAAHGLGRALGQAVGGGTRGVRLAAASELHGELVVHLRQGEGRQGQRGQHRALHLFG